MNKTRKINGFKMSVKAWDNKVTVTDIKTKQIIKEIVFSDHIQAMMALTNL